MNAPGKYAIVTAAILGFGAARLPYEAALSKELRDRNLFPVRLDIDTRERIGQTFSAVSLGGLRTLVATFLNLRAFTAFTETRWDDVAETFETIVALAPRTRYYWETGSWHQAYNAASYYVNDTKLPPVRRRYEWRNSIAKGRAFLERGIQNNPHDWSLHNNLGFLLTDPNKFTSFRDIDAAFLEAADHYAKAAASPGALDYVNRSRCYALARVAGHEAEALDMARRLYQESRKNHTPTLLCLLFVLESHEDPDGDSIARAERIFGSLETAYEQLSMHWQRTRERFPVHGVAQALGAMEIRLGIPAAESVINQPLPAPVGPDTWFQQ